MKQYDFYKDSGVEWIGEVPSHWEVVHLKRILREHMQYGANEPAESDNILYPRYIRITDITENSELRPETFKSLEPSKAKDYLLDKGDVLFARSGATVGKTFLFNADIKACYAGYLIKASCNRRKMLPEYLYYYTLSGAYECWKNSVFVQSTIQNIGADKYQLMYIPVPSINEQNAMLSYLNKKCSEINKVISAQQKRITLLQELKQSVITHAVTKGLNPNVEMKDSGVEWIGKVPKHWELIRTRYLCNLCTGNKDTINRVDDGKYPFYVRSPKIERIDTYSFDGEAILMAGDGVGAGKVFHYANGKFDYHQRVYNFHDFKKVTGKFFYYYIANNFRYVIEEGGAKNTVDSVRLYMIQNFLMTVPPKKEQGIICEYIERQESIFNIAISKAQHQVELLQEYKQSLITEVVTGKRKIS